MPCESRSSLAARLNSNSSFDSSLQFLKCRRQWFDNDGLGSSIRFQRLLISFKVVVVGIIEQTVDRMKDGVNDLVTRETEIETT